MRGAGAAAGHSSALPPPTCLLSLCRAALAAVTCSLGAGSSGSSSPFSPSPWQAQPGAQRDKSTLTRSTGLTFPPPPATTSEGQVRRCCCAGGAQKQGLARRQAAGAAAALSALRAPPWLLAHSTRCVRSCSRFGRTKCGLPHWTSGAACSATAASTCVASRRWALTWTTRWQVLGGLLFCDGLPLALSVAAAAWLAGVPCFEAQPASSSGSCWHLAGCRLQAQYKPDTFETLAHEQTIDKLVRKWEAVGPPSKQRGPGAAGAGRLPQVGTRADAAPCALFLMLPAGPLLWLPRAPAGPHL